MKQSVSEVFAKKTKDLSAEEFSFVMSHYIARGDIGAAKTLAKELTRSRDAVKKRTDIIHRLEAIKEHTNIKAVDEIIAIIRNDAA